MRPGLAELRDSADPAPSTMMSFESVNLPGHFLRHRNFELWVEPHDGSLLFINDATFRPRYLYKTIGLNQPFVLRAYNKGHYIRHYSWVVQLADLVNEEDRLDATFSGRPALNSSPEAMSFESVNSPGHFLRHQDYRLKLHPNDGSELFGQDASFIPHPGRIPEPGFSGTSIPGSASSRLTFAVTSGAISTTNSSAKTRHSVR